ncbi:uncharacterized protein LOC142977757 [Anticarsia gemmatalis]|uniref:uncharacterized protein LOC142977757 n=1 Tax=Anticarsia gemmatalis TaxID=129554 RepID=UPI003F764FAA
MRTSRCRIPFHSALRQSPPTSDQTDLYTSILPQCDCGWRDARTTIGYRRFNRNVSGFDRSELRASFLFICKTIGYFTTPCESEHHHYVRIVNFLGTYDVITVATIIVRDESFGLRCRIKRFGSFDWQFSTKIRSRSQICNNIAVTRTLVEEYGR